ncbi:ATP-binding protein [Kribbella kalugense]|uniref:ATPase family protein associated with various cellular activities (AAA) n=1 Tax=Kribbella kalugense TaxID=2512221 RepID=A0A4R7ZVE7_9ACTN|nr:ATP-binding protein [Kribbella kalugense]TDW22077.1 ATPase family protein associated with various cellular activities (AAA) [Kribbella kalugense]
MAASVSTEEPAVDEQSWVEANQAYLVASLADLSATMRSEPSVRPAEMEPPAALETLCASFGLSAFERAVLLLCAGVELDARFASLCAEAAGDPNRRWPTFGLALATLPGAHWSALTPDGALRRWRLIEVAEHSPLTTAELRIDERVLHHLTGLRVTDAKLTGIVSPVETAAPITPGQRPSAHELVNAWRSAEQLVGVLTGADRSTRIAVAAHAAQDLGLRLSLLEATTIPAAVGARDELARLLERESALGTTAFLVEGHDDWSLVDALVATSAARIAVSADESAVLPRCPTLSIEVPAPTATEQRELWRTAVGPDAPIEELVAAFDLSATVIGTAATAAGGDSDALWSACRAVDRPRLTAHARRIESTAQWDDLVLPAPQRRTLEMLVAHARHRVQVYDDWGLRMGRSAGLGSTALFGGPSGTGKTFAAEVIANEIGLDLYRVDLSAVVSKYIGETEKNLRQVFDAADHGAAVLLFDEADALFGKRTEVRDSHDRYANVEVSYLLQRLEAYRGIAILTTNLSDAVDTAFLRRIRYVVQFPFPDEKQRARLWQRAFPAETPTADLHIGEVAKLALSGGGIRNVAVNAAVLAADAGTPVRMEHILQAARLEAVKSGLPVASIRPEAGA